MGDEEEDVGGYESEKSDYGEFDPEGEVNYNEVREKGRSISRRTNNSSRVIHHRTMTMTLVRKPLQFSRKATTQRTGTAATTPKTRTTTATRSQRPLPGARIPRKTPSTTKTLQTMTTTTTTTTVTRSRGSLRGSPSSRPGLGLQPCPQPANSAGTRQRTPTRTMKRTSPATRSPASAAASPLAWGRGGDMGAPPGALARAASGGEASGAPRRARAPCGPSRRRG